MSSDTPYTTMAGLQAIDARMDALSANLANVQTAGYQAVQAMTEAAPYEGRNAPYGADTVALTPGPDATAGALNHTGEPLNVGLGGDAWLVVQSSQGFALTRNGALQITADGILSTRERRRTPAVSISVNFSPSRSKGTSTASRVVPG